MKNFNNPTRREFDPNQISLMSGGTIKHQQEEQYIVGSKTKANAEQPVETGGGDQLNLPATPPITTRRF